LPLDLALFVLALLFATAFRFEAFLPPDPYPDVLGWYFVITLPLKVFCFVAAGLYRRMWRFAGLVDFQRLLLATGMAGIIGFVVGGWALPVLGVIPVRVPLSILALDALLTTALTAFPRFMTRLFTRRALHALSGQPPRRVLIAGAGAAGDLVARDLLAHPSTGMLPVGFLDDSPTKQGLRLQGLPVLGRLPDLARVAADHGVDEVIIAMPSATGQVIRAVLESAQAVKVPARTVPSLKEVMSGRLRVTSLRPVQIEDLLRREPVQTAMDQVRALIRGRRVLVTGAGGSIGSELCRQIVDAGPSRLILLGHGENSIFTINAELQGRCAAGVVVPVIADVRDTGRILDVMRMHRPAIVFHAAAHKHVPLMEWNVPEAVSNNVLGTRNLLEAAAESGVAHFVLVSTDKAVKPTSVMGATKRVAELLVQDCAERHGRNYFSVRFGNVLGSRGSVVPNFLQQIEAGGPVTVTHPEMRRYFMTIPEAVQLVLQATVLGQGGDVFVLDMGEPIKIVDLARDLIRLSGLEVGRDIDIKFTGVRPGEKLYEELFFGSEMASPTPHPKILRARHEPLPADLADAIDVLLTASKEGTDSELRAQLLEMVPDYAPDIGPGNVIPPASMSQGLKVSKPNGQ
jgi:FlaA1/EpsC-like NDP-sugar epimerase